MMEQGQECGLDNLFHRGGREGSRANKVASKHKSFVRTSLSQTFYLKPQMSMSRLGGHS